MKYWKSGGRNFANQQKRSRALDRKGPLSFAALEPRMMLAPVVQGLDFVAANDLLGNHAIVTFANAIDPATFSPSDVNITAPDQSLINVLSVDANPGSGNQQFDILFDGSATPAVYAITIGPDIADPLGNLMDQDGDGTLGEPVEDQFNGQVQVADSVTGWTFTIDGSVEQKRIAVDTDGTFVLVGRLQGTVDFDPGPGQTWLTSNGTMDAYVAKYTRDRQLLWVKQFGGTGSDYARELDVDPAGNIYFAGNFTSSSADFGSYTLQSNGYEDTFIAKLDADGNVQWAGSLGSVGGNERTYSLDVTDNGEVFLAGGFWESVDFDPGPGSEIRTVAGGVDGYVLSLDADGEFRWVWTFGGPAAENQLRVQADALGNAYVSGLFHETATFGQSVTLTSAGDGDGFVAKLDSSGIEQWVRHFSGIDQINRTRLAADTDGNSYIAVSFLGTVDLGPGAPTFSGDQTDDTFVLSLDTNNNVRWAQHYSGTDLVQPRELDVDASGSLFLTGHFAGTIDLDPGAGSSSFSAVDTDVFLLGLDTSTGAYRWAHQFSGAGALKGFGVVADSAGSLYTSGDFDQYLITPTGETILTSSTTGYITRLDIAPTVSVVPIDNHITTEAGGQSQFGVVLSIAPTSNVTVSVSTSDSTEGTTDVSSLTFTPADWTTPQIVTVTGVDDAMEDDDVQYHVVFGPAISSDPVYNGLDAPDVLFINIDDDAFTPTVIFADSFESGQWNGLWVEDSQNDWFTSTQRSTAGNYSAEVDGNASNATLTNASPIDMSGYGSAELTFDWYIESGFDGGEYVKLDFWNGSNWIEIRSLDGNVDQENTWHTETVHLENEPSGDYLRSDFQFRFRAKVSSSTEDANVDNVQLLATSLSGPPNEAPGITSVPVTVATEDSLYTYDVDAVDPNPGDVITFSLNTAPAGMTINSSTGVILWTPTNTDVGNHSIVVRAEDAGGLFDTQSFDILVANVNDAPSITTLPTTEATENELYSYNVDASDPDVGDLLTFSLDIAAAGMTIDGASGLIEWTPTSGQIGDHDVTVRVQDIAGLFDTQSFTITVVETNVAPTITTAPILAATEDALYTYDVDASDANSGDTLVFSLDTAPAGMTVNATSGVIQWTPTNAQVGPHDVTVRVEDSGGLFDTQSFSIAVANVNDAPSIISTPVTSATEDAFYSYDVNASDPDVGDILTFWLDTSPVGMSINSSSGLIEWTPTNGQIGDHAVTVRVEDASGASGMQSFLITVSPAGPTETELFYDSFEIGNNSNDWNGNWVEDSQNDFFRSTQRATDGIRSAEVDGFANNTTLTLSTPVDISGFASAQLTFDWLIESGFDSGEYLSLDVSTNGGASWTQDVRQLRGNVDAENTWHNETVDLTAFSTTNLLIRFRSTVSGSSEDADIDNVRIVGNSSASRGIALEPNHSVEAASYFHVSNKLFGQVDHLRAQWQKWSTNSAGLSVSPWLNASIPNSAVNWQTPEDLLPRDSMFETENFEADWVDGELESQPWIDEILNSNQSFNGIL